MAQLTGPEGYLADSALMDALNTALYLGQPLLITGEPGSGKTELANFVAWKLGLEQTIKVDDQGRNVQEFALRFDTKSETRARDLFYSIDVVARFHAAHQSGGTVDPLKFITFQALGRAILYANPPNALSDRLPLDYGHPGIALRSVVLIDEIDKAPRDVPNDLLMEIERLQFFIPELNLTVAAPHERRPIVIITSNSEKALPEAFLRRCVYYHLTFPDRGRLKEIVASRMIRLPRTASLLDDAITVFNHVRLHARGKRPGTAELLAFLLALRAKGYEPNDSLRSRGDWSVEARVTLMKSMEDQGSVIEGFSWAQKD
jgi:MoxR-like ATPase